MSDARIGYAVFGCGVIAQDHLKGAAGHPRARLVAVVDANPQAAQAAREKFGAARAYTNWEEALRDEEIQALSLCMPNSLHEDVTVAAAECGKHVLVEKPMALSLAGCDRMLAACEARGVTLMVGQVLRFWEPHRKVREILDSGRIGRPRHLLRRRTGWQKEIRRDWYRKDTEGSMVLYSYAPHEVDIMLWWVRERPARVYAQGLKNNPYWNQDELSVVVTTEQGTILSLSQSLNSRTHQWDQLVIGSEESLYVNGNEIRIGEKEALTVERKSGPAEEVREFVNAILEGRLPEAHGRDVRATMEVLDAAERSMRANQAVELGLVSAARSAPE